MSGAQKLKGLWPLPGGVEKYFETALDLLEFVKTESPTEDQLKDYFRTHYGVDGPSSLPQYVRVLVNLRLISVKNGLCSLAPEGTAWQQARDPIAAYHQLNERFEAIESLLQLCAQATGTLNDVHSALCKLHGYTWQSTNQTFFRVCWLRSLGLVERDESGLLAATVKGKLLAGGGSPPGTPPPPPPPAQPNPPGTASPPPPSSIEVACLELEATAKSGGDGASFERAVAAAFCLLGYEARRIGGSGKPDVVVDIRRGTSPVRLVVETKSSTHGSIQDSQINWDSISDHRHAVQADLAVVVGGGFAGGNLEKRATEKNIRLLRVDQLVQILRAHDAQPLAAGAPLPLFQGSGSLADEALAAFAEEAEARPPWPELLAQVYRTVWERQAETKARVDTNALFFLLDQEHDSEVLGEVVRFLSSPLVGALETDAEGRLRTRVSPSVFTERLRRFVGAVDAPAADETEGDGS